MTPIKIYNLKFGDVAQRQAMYHKIVGSAFIWQRGRVLIVQHGTGRNQGRWNLPGGRVDGGESITQTAIRETLEETGYRVKLSRTIAAFEFSNRTEKPCARAVFLGHISRGRLEVDGDEITDARWIKWKHLLVLPKTNLCHSHQLRYVFRLIQSHELDRILLADSVGKKSGKKKSAKVEKKKKYGAKKGKRKVAA